jgi:tRNA (cmo5U34)-methyltransferase
MNPPATTPGQFDQQHADAYDERWAPLAALRDSLHLQTGFVLSDLPADARVLCVGVGTGAELLALAARFPGWRFVAIEPSAPMLDVCRRKAVAAGIADRCEFHSAYLHDLPDVTGFHAATSILVSQFITDRAKRVAFFRDIASRLLPGGWLVTADLGRVPEEQHAQLISVWQRMMQFVGVTAEQFEAMLDAYKRDVAIISPADMEALLREAGFGTPVGFSQSLLIHAWYARRIA